MKLTNQKIYDYASQLAEAFGDGSQKLPIKINFYLQKNKKLLLELAEGIEESRLSIAQAYGELNEEGTQYVVKPENVETVQKELVDLFTLEQEVDIYTINIDSINEDITLTTGQMEALMFMID